MAHGNAIGDGDRCKLSRCAATSLHAFLNDLRLASERNVAGRSFVPRGGYADQRLGDCIISQTHGM